MGITGHKLSGTMKRVKGTPYWEVTAIPITPYKDDLSFDPLQVAKVTVRNARTNKIIAVQPKVVVPVSDEMRCDLCHGPVDTAGSILQAHDAANATHLYTDLQAGVRHACSECHKDNALGAPGLPGVKPLSQAIHGAHADKMDTPAVAAFGTPCYTCHPGAQTKCLRGRMAQAGFTCTSAGCHGDMAQVADSQARRPRRPGCRSPRAAAATAPGTREPGAALPQLVPAQRPRGHERQDHPVRVLPRQPARGVAVRPGRSTTRCRCSCRVLATFIKRCSACHGDASGRIHGAAGGRDRRRRRGRDMDYDVSEKELDPQLALTHRAPVTMATIGDGDRRRVRRAHGARRQDRRPVCRSAVRPLSGCV